MRWPSGDTAIVSIWLVDFFGENTLSIALLHIGKILVLISFGGKLLSTGLTIVRFEYNQRFIPHEERKIDGRHGFFKNSVGPDTRACLVYALGFPESALSNAYSPLRVPL